MFTQYDKAGAAVLAGVITTLLGQFTHLTPEQVGAIGTLVGGALVYLVPNKPAPAA